VGQLVLGEAIGCPTPFIDQRKNLHLRGAQLFQIFLGTKLDSSQEKGSVGQLARVGSRFCKFPVVLVRDAQLQNHRPPSPESKEIAQE
jgi:hypothetical protein